MNRFSTRLRLAWAAMAACFLLTAPAAAQEPACNQTTWPANAATGPVVDNYCDNNPAKPCDLAIASWSLPAVEKSPDIRIGKAVDASPEEPRFLFDSAGNRFYAKLYVKLANSPGQGPAPASQVKVHLHYKEGATPANPTVTTGWTAIGSYPMTIPAPAPVGALFPSQTHIQDQTRPVCWTLPAGDKNLPKQFTLRAQVEWLKGSVNQDDDTGNNTAYSFYDLTTQERKAQIAFAMDLSGSMQGIKLTQAQQKAGMFTHLIEDGDGLGVYGFATHNTTDNTPFTATYKVTPAGPDHTLTMHETREVSAFQTINSLAHRVTISNRIAATTANGCTPVGQGLLRAWAGLPASPPSDVQQAIVVFSDGLQNVHPYVNTAASWNCHPSTPAAPMLDSALTFGGDDVKVYSIFWGPTSGYAHDLMQNIQTQTGSDVLYGTVTELGLASAYYSIRALVDDMLFFEESGVTSPGAADQFTVVFDPTPEPATVSAAWNWDGGQTQLEIWCRQKKPGSQFVPCAQLGQVDRPVEAFSSDSYTVFRFVPGPDTTWDFEVRQVKGSGPAEYAAAVFSPVQEAQIFPALDNVGFETGEPLPIQAELRRAGAPVTGASVSAVVRAPARSFASTLRRFSDRLNVPASGDDRAAKVVAQLQGLLRQEGSDELYPVRKITVPMTDNGDGTYSGVLPGKSTEIAGEYQVTITAQLTLPSGRTVQRIAKLSALCNVGPPDPGKSLVKVLLPDPARDRSLATVTVWPTDRFGNAAFPGSGSQISLAATGATLVGSLRDNLVSGFTQQLEIIDPGVLPRVAVKARGVPLGTPYLVPRGRELSFHFGTAVPNGTFDVLYDQGPSIGVDYAWLLNSKLAVRVELVHDDFDVSAGGNEEMLNLSAYLRYRKDSGTWLPYFETGAGLYDLLGTTAAGCAGGLGLQRELTPRWNIDLNLQGHYVGGNLGISFSRLRVGAIYKF